jgi:hypothetical protein
MCVVETTAKVFSVQGKPIHQQDLAENREANDQLWTTPASGQVAPSRVPHAGQYDTQPPQSDA